MLFPIGCTEQFLNSRDQSTGLGLLHHSADSILVGRETQFGRCVECVQNDRNLRQEFVNLFRGTESIQTRHRVVQNYQIRMQLGRTDDRFSPIDRLATNLPTRVVSQQRL